MSQSSEIRHDHAWAHGRPVWLADELPSTQDALRRWADEGAPHGATVVARRQSAGRGRQGRLWRDTARGNVYASVLLRHDTELERLPAFALAAGLAVRSSCAGWVELGLKWPNDLWLAGRKVGGLLLECPASTQPQVIVGLGLNLRRPAGGWGDLQTTAISFEEAGVDVDPFDVLGTWLPELERRWQLFVESGIHGQLSEWTEADVLAEQRIEWVHSGRRLRGRVVGVGEDGALRVRDDANTLLAIHAGEVHLTGATS